MANRFKVTRVPDDFATVADANDYIRKLVRDIERKELADVTRNTVFPFTEVSGVYSISAQDGVVNCVGTSYTITLPSAVDAEGRIYFIKNSASGNITIDTSSLETIDGSLTQVITPTNSLKVCSTSTNWIII